MNQFISNLIRSVHTTGHFNMEILVYYSGADEALPRQSLTLTAQALKLNVISTALTAKQPQSTSEDTEGIEIILNLCEGLKQELEQLKSSIKTDKYSDVQASRLIHQYLTQQYAPIIEKIIVRYNLERAEIDLKTQVSFENFIAELTDSSHHLFALSQQAFAGLVVDDNPVEIAQRQLFTWRQNTRPAEDEHLEIETWQIIARLDSQTDSDAAVQTAQQNITISQSSDELNPLEIKTQYLPLTTEEENLFISAVPELIQDDSAIPQWFKELFISPGILAITENMQNIHDTVTTIDACIKGVIPGQAATELKKLLQDNENLTQLKTAYPEINTILNLMDRALFCIANDDLRAEFHHKKIHDVLRTLVTTLKSAGEAYFKQDSLMSPAVSLFEQQRQLSRDKKQRALDLTKIEILLQAVEQKAAKFKQIADEIVTQREIASMGEYIGHTQAEDAANKARQLSASTTQEKAKIDATAQAEIIALATLSIDEIIAEDQDGKLFLQKTLREIVELDKKITEINTILTPQAAPTTITTRSTDDVVQVIAAAPTLSSEQQPLIQLKRPKNISYKTHRYFSTAKKLVMGLSLLTGLISAGYIGLKLIAASSLFIAGLTALSISVAAASGSYLIGLGIIHTVRVIFEKFHNKQNLTKYNKLKKELAEKEIAAPLVPGTSAPAVIPQVTITDCIAPTIVEPSVPAPIPPSRLEQAIAALDSITTVQVADSTNLLQLYSQGLESMQSKFSTGISEITAQIHAAENNPEYNRRKRAHLASIAIARRQAQATERAQAEQAPDNIQALLAQPAAQPAQSVVQQEKTQQERIREQRVAAMAARGII